MKLLQRTLQARIEQWLFKGKTLILYGPRQSGKTTLARQLLAQHEQDGAYLNCDLLAVRQILESEEPLRVKQAVGDKRFVVLDEAQRVRNIGLVLKLLHDEYPDMQVLATGSSSFDLANKVNEPLTGRAIEFRLFPFSYEEMAMLHSPLDLDRMLPQFLRYGTYPDIVGKPDTVAAELLDNLAANYLYKDVLDHEQLKKPDLLVKLLRLLALQLGCEVSRHELATALQVTRETVDRYLDLLEKSFVIIRLGAFSRNLRKEISKKEKIYFIDNGVRNSLIRNYNTLDIRDDVGALWENACIVERMKLLAGHGLRRSHYFWRTHDQKEIDLIEEHDGRLDGYEFKWKEKNARTPAIFLETYGNSSVTVVNRVNWLNFLTVMP